MKHNENENEGSVSSYEREWLGENVLIVDVLDFLNIPAENYEYLRCPLNDCGGSMMIMDEWFDCSRCGVAGDVFTFVREILKCSENDAVRVVRRVADPDIHANFGGWLQAFAHEDCLELLRELEGKLEILRRGLRISRPDEEWQFFGRFSDLVFDFCGVELKRIYGVDGGSDSGVGGRLDQPDAGHGSRDRR